MAVIHIQKIKTKKIGLLMNNILILLLLKIIFVNSIIINYKSNLNNYYSEIHLVIQGSGEQSLLNSGFNPEPSEVYINGVKKDSCKKSCNLEKDKNNIILRFDNPIESCEKIFEGLYNITEIDLSNFDASKVTTMREMFSLCQKLEKINFGNIDTSSLEDMYDLFDGCSKLTSIDLSNLDTSKVTSMSYMFSNCKNLDKINFGNINTSSLETMEYSFYNCNSLTTIDLSNFDTSKVTSMFCIFYKCSNLKYLDLSNFDFTNLEEAESMFDSCSSLIFLNIYNFQLKYSYGKDDIFKSINPNVKYCTKDSDLKNYISENYNIESNCNDICFQKNKKIDIYSSQCLESCSQGGYDLEYNNMCEYECPTDTYPLSSDKDVKECLEKTPEGYYLDVTNKIYKKCFENCKFCYGEGNKANHNCKECNPNYIFWDDSKYKNNCYKDCNFSFYPYYFDESNEYHCSEKFKGCPEKYNKYILEKNKCIDNCKNDDTYRYEFNNICFTNCPSNTSILEDNEFLCYNITLNGYYLDNKNKIYKRCYETCGKCESGGNEINHNCIECKSNYEFYKNLKNVLNCYEKCEYYYYFDELNNFLCTNDYKCPEQYNRLIKEKNKCIDNCENDDTHIHEYQNICYEKLPNDIIKYTTNYITNKIGKLDDIIQKTTNYNTYEIKNSEEFINSIYSYSTILNYKNENEIVDYN